MEKIQMGKTGFSIFRWERGSVIELTVIALLSVLTYILSGRYDIIERFSHFSNRHELWELDELVSVVTLLMIAFLVVILRDRRRLAASRATVVEKNESLQQALSEIKQLKGLIPICSHCKKIRDGEGVWHQLEAYIQQRTDARFSHGICPDCVQLLYPEEPEHTPQPSACPGLDAPAIPSR